MTEAQEEPADWLPPLVSLADSGGVWGEYIEELYRHFCRDFKLSQPALAGRRWGMKRYPTIQGKEATFWHIISEGDRESQRLPDLRRCERIRWPRAMLDAIPTANVVTWEQSRKGSRNLVVSLPDYSYIVVVALRPAYAMLWTAFLIERERSRERLRSEHERWRRELRLRN